MPLKNQNPSQIKGQILFTLSFSKATLTSIKAVFVTRAQIRSSVSASIYLFLNQKHAFSFFFLLIKTLLLCKDLKTQRQILPAWLATFPHGNDLY